MWHRSADWRARLQPPVSKESPDLIVGAVEPEDQGPSVPMKQQPMVERIPAFYEVVDDSQADAYVQVRSAVNRRSGSHGG